MAKIALITGAGASAAFGYPVTNRILLIVRERMREKTLFTNYAESDGAADELERYLTALFPGLHDPTVTLPNITDVISLVDHAIATSSTLIRGMKLADHVRFRFLLEWATVDTLSQPEDTPRLRDQVRRLHEVSDYLAALVSDGKNQLGIVTTNYDTALDAQLFARIAPDPKYTDAIDDEAVAERFDFGTTWRSPYRDVIFPRPVGAPLHIYKLHGSVNWLRCDFCENIYVNPDGNIVHWAFYPHDHEHNQCYCFHARLRSAIVAPSFVRGAYDLTLQSVWKASLDFLRAADRWVIIGYSLPSEDVAIRALLIKALQSRRTGPAIDVVQPDEDAKPRYMLLFPDCGYHAGGFDAYPLSAIH